MTRFRNVSVRGKLLATLGLLVVATALVEAASFVALRSTSAVFQDLTLRQIPGLEALLQADSAMQQALVAERSLIAVKPKSPVADAIRGAFTAARATAEDVATASKQLATATTEISAGAQEQATNLEETAATLRSLTETVRHSAEGAEQADRMAATARDAAETGRRVVTETVEAMREIESSSKHIGDITTAIDEIAFQTNLLALNAAVEAARAGDQGRGFAVVAAEVRSLAQRAAGAAKEITGLIRTSLEKVEAGAGLVQPSGATLDEIVAGARRVTEVVDGIAVSSREQAAGIEQVNRAVSSMHEVTQGNAERTEELSSTTAAVAARAAKLLAAMSRFTTEAAQPRHEDGVRTGGHPETTA